MEDANLLALWGKTDRGDPARYHPLLFHMLDVAAVCEALLPRFGEVEPLPRPWLLYLAALHDIGKADPLFQAKAPEQADRLRREGWEIPVAAEGFRHEARSAEWVRTHLMEKHDWGRGRLVAADALHGHHGNFQSPLNDGDEAERPGGRFARWEAIRAQHADRLWGLLDVEPFHLDRFPHASAGGVRLSGLVVLADWIASNEDLMGALSLAWSLRERGSFAAPEIYLREARAAAVAVVERMLLVGPSAPRAEVRRFSDVWPACRTLRPSQAALEKLCLNEPPAPGLAIIEAPMGEGKTEAAVYLAEQWRMATGRDGVYIALPTAATSNQMHARYAEFLRAQHPDSPAPRLVHGMAWLIDDTTPGGAMQLDTEDAGTAAACALALDWFRPSKRALLAPEGVGTVDQALMAALHVKHGFLRLLGLSSKVLIIDEVHAYDAYMTTILRRLLAWCRALGTPVVLLSATLSRAQKDGLVEAYAGPVSPPGAGGPEPYPLLTFAAPGSLATRVAVPRQRDDERTVRIRTHPGLLGDLPGTACLAARVTADGGCACVLANTVKDAQRIYRALRRMRLPHTDLILFHARFRAEERNERERRVVDLFGKDAGERRPRRAILVATQVVEQSLDVDFDVMITQLAPMDLLLQRSGRMHRHARGPRPTGPDAVLHVLLPAEGEFAFGSTGHVYQPEILLRTFALLHGRDALRLPADFRELVEGCYSEGTLAEEVVPAPVLTAAVAKRRAALAKEESEARTHLIPEPSARDFGLAKAASGAVDESEEGARASYFHAQTRLGDDSRSVLVLHRPELVKAALAEDAPPRSMLKRLFLQKVNVPGWWLRSLRTADGSPVDFSGPAWLRQCLVIPFSDGEWRGEEEVRTDEWRAITLRDDPDEGLLRIVEGEDDDNV